MVDVTYISGKKPGAQTLRDKRREAAWWGADCLTVFYAAIIVCWSSINQELFRVARCFAAVG